MPSETSRERRASARNLLTASPAKPVAAAAAEQKPAYFDDFTALDAAGNRFSLARFQGQAILVSFWSPKNKASGWSSRPLPLFTMNSTAAGSMLSA